MYTIILEVDNPEINHSCVCPGQGCLEWAGLFGVGRDHTKTGVDEQKETTCSYKMSSRKEECRCRHTEKKLTFMDDVIIVVIVVIHLRLSETLHSRHKSPARSPVRLPQRTASIRRFSL